MPLMHWTRFSSIAGGKTERASLSKILSGPSTISSMVNSNVGCMRATDEVPAAADELAPEGVLVKEEVRAAGDMRATDKVPAREEVPAAAAGRMTGQVGKVRVTEEVPAAAAARVPGGVRMPAGVRVPGEGSCKALQDRALGVLSLSAVGVRNLSISLARSRILARLQSFEAPSGMLLLAVLWICFTLWNTGY